MNDGAPPPPYPSPVAAWWTVGVFSLVAMASVLDRGILNMIVDPVRHDLGISEVQISLLQGLAFGLFYATVGLPLGLGADRFSRRWLILAGVSVWSLATLYGGFATDYAGMFASRVLVGLGEATLSPAAISMISDLFPAHRRGRPISIFLMGQGLASGLSIGLTGFILTGVPAGRFAFLFGTDPPPPWRAAFMICGALGLPAIALVLTVREPRRRGARIADAGGAGIASVAAYVVRNYRVLVPLYLGFAVASLAIYGASAWLPTLLTRGFGLTFSEVGEWFGPVATGAGVAGALAGGLAVDRVSRRGRGPGKLLMLTLVTLAALPGAFAVLAPNGVAAVFVAAILIAAFPIIGTTVISATQEMMPNDMRGIAISLMGFTNAVIGSTLGPLLVALATRDVFRDDRRVGEAVAMVASVALALAAGIFYFGYRALRRSLAAPADLGRIMTIEALRET